MAAVTPYLLVEHLTKSVGDKMLFEDISFALNKGDRLALIARNGIGKTTLMDILMQQTDYDSGTTTWRRDLKVHYLPQIIPLIAGEEHLSGGERKRRAIQRVLDDEPDLLLLDEPTNHLDLDTVVWLEDYLINRTARSDKALTILMVTHDRYFLDRVCTHILEIDNQEMFTYAGNYSYYIQKRTERLEQRNALADKYRNLYRTELDWMRRMPQARAHKAQYRIDNFYEIERKAQKVATDTNVRLTVQSGYIGNKIFEAKNVCKRFVSPSSGEEKIIVHHFDYVFSRYEKLGIIGKNGTGKSTFLKMLLGEVPPDSGCFDVGSTVRFGYFAQTGLTFEPGKKVIDLIRDCAETIDTGDGNRMSASQFLQLFLFSPQQQYDYVDKLSGGEKQRLHLCRVLMQNPNFLILDEPTNDLDIPTLQVLEQYLQTFRGCLIVVSHDRFFMDKVVDHLFVFRGQGNIEDFPGNYTQYREAQALKAQTDKNADKNADKSVAVKTNTAKSVTAKTNNHTGTNDSSGEDYHIAPNAAITGSTDAQRPRKLSFKEKQLLAQLEQQIPQLEQQKAQLEADLSGKLTDPAAIAQASEHYRQVSEALSQAEMQWLELSD